ncbi:MAG: hypothetical protein KatS3mg077_3252 [Candidatus Binatia bacterium]|nr:MAG: hypothetical protein KatS3mg077_3252 [Candidatus Binatia bacterium]
MEKSDCELCKLVPTTRWYEEYEGAPRFVILDCDSCDVPMAVLREHRARVETWEREVIERRLGAVAERVFPQGWFFDDHMRQIPDHYHMHARPLPGTFGPTTRPRR